MAMAMVISSSTSYITTAHIFSLSSFPPLKTGVGRSGFVLNLHTNCLNFRFLSQTSSSSACSVKPISSNYLRKILRVSNTQTTYSYPDPIPEFAKSETQKFRGEFVKKLSKSKESFGGDLNKVVNVCAEIFSKFLHKEYGGPGTLLVEPFTAMLVSLKEKNLPGAPIAARTALLWAQNYLDKDWEVWNAKPPK